MKVIVEANKTVLNLLNQTLNLTEFIPTEYKQSKYNKIFEVNNKKYIYNVFTGFTALLDDKEFETFKKNNFTNCFKSDLLFLSSNGLLVHNNNNEEQIYLQSFNIIRNIDKGDGFRNYTILPTTACNARCFYCFEAGYIPESMTIEKAREVAEYILKTRSSDEIRIFWFGGEPLCNVKVINEICSILEKNNINFSSKMLSNGLLFSKDIIQQAKNLWHMRKVQITFDGMQDEHNRRKNYLTKLENPFEKTINVVRDLLSEDIAVTIRINIDLDNYNSASELLDYLYLNFSGFKKFNVYPEMLYDASETWNSNRTEEQNSELLEKYKILYEKAVNLGLYQCKKINSRLKTCHCMANNPNYIVINQSGHLFLCDHCNDDSKVGNIHTGIINNEVYDAWVNRISISEKCKGCTFLPLCTPFSKCPDHNADCKAKVENSIKHKLLSFLNKNF